MTEDNKNNDELKEFTENPFDPENKRPEDIVRLFYTHNVPIIPVISKRGMLLGILRKDDVISELSDIERVEKLKIDHFITRLAKKMSFDDLLEYGKIREFLVINIFGEFQKTWTRLQLFSACENHQPVVESEINQQKEEQVLEWIIYLILEHIPRALYAVNKSGKTIFFNSHFESLYESVLSQEIDTNAVEKSLKKADVNELLSGKDATELFFYNKDLNIYYEKIPLFSNKKKVGFLIFCDREDHFSTGLMMTGVDMRKLSLSETIASIERKLVVDALKDGNLSQAADDLKITKQNLSSKIKKFDIEYKRNKDK